MTIYKVKCLYNELLKEYATDDAMFTSIAGKSGTKGSGKKADNIATGQAKQYKDATYFTKYEKMLPHLAKITQDLKTNQSEISLEIFGPALEELLILVKAKKPFKRDENGELILPMGDNIRLIKNGTKYFAKYVGIKAKEEKKDTIEPAKSEIETTNYVQELLPNFTEKLI